MALIQCSECGQMVSDKAAKCPKCGCPIERRPVPPVQQPQARPQRPQQPQAAQQPQEGQGRGKTVAIVLLSVVLIVVIALGLFLFIGDKEPTNAKDKNIVDEGDAPQEKVHNKENVQAEPSNTINGHEYVDLGLSVKWATCNVDASSPEEYGDYFAWGETSTKSEYTTEKSKTIDKNMCSIAGDPSYDAARANWGGTWRLPTLDEIDELLNRCTWTWTRWGDSDGYEVMGPNGNSIFLPAAGWRNGTTQLFREEKGSYWSATPVGDNASYAYALSFHSGYHDDSGWGGRNNGMSVRPISE